MNSKVLGLLRISLALLAFFGTGTVVMGACPTTYPLSVFSSFYDYDDVVDERFSQPFFKWSFVLGMIAVMAGCIAWWKDQEDRSIGFSLAINPFCVVVFGVVVSLFSIFLGII